MLSPPEPHGLRHAVYRQLEPAARASGVSPLNAALCVLIVISVLAAGVAATVGAGTARTVVVKPAIHRTPPSSRR